MGEFPRLAKLLGMIHEVHLCALRDLHILYQASKLRVSITDHAPVVDVRRSDDRVLIIHHHDLTMDVDNLCLPYAFFILCVGS